MASTTLRYKSATGAEESSLSKVMCRMIAKMFLSKKLKEYGNKDQKNPLPMTTHDSAHHGKTGL